MMATRRNLYEAKPHSITTFRVDSFASSPPLSIFHGESGPMSALPPGEGRGRMRQGFTLLEVVIALAIMGTVILTVLGSVNYHLGVIANERDNTTFTLLARARMAELEQSPLQQKSEGSFAPNHPELKWQAELFPTQLPALQKLVVKVRRDADKREVALVRFVLK